MGLLWEVPADSTEAAAQLSTFSEMGFTYLELTEPVQRQTLVQTGEFGFTVLIRTDHRFYREIDLREQKNALTSQYKEMVEQYKNYPHVGGFGILSQSQVRHEVFSAEFDPVLDSLQAQSSRTFYFVNGDNWYNFKEPDNAFGSLFHFSDFKPYHILQVDQIHSNHQSNLAFVQFYHAGWLLQALEFHPPLAESFRIYHKTGNWNMPIPTINRQKTNQSGLVLLLLLMWAALAVQLKYFPYLRSMILRYFFAHRFYVDDILHYRERAAAGGILMMLKHAIFGGMVLYVVSKILISDHGLEAFFHHFPFLSLFGESHLSFLFLGSVLIALIEIIALFWLYLPAKNLSHLSQTINLYAGIFYLDFIIVTAIVTLFSAGLGNKLIFFLSVLFVLIWFAAFNLAAFSSTQSMGNRRSKYLLLTIGTHTLVFAALIFLIATNEYIIQTIQLAITI